MSDRTIVIAVDGMEPSLVDRWCAAGELPAIRRLRNRGVYGTATCRSLSSAKQWTTHFTGVESDRHGVTGFTTSNRSRRAGDDAPDARELVNLSNIAVETYPELLDDAGYSVGLLNPLPLWPPLEFEDGFCVSGMLTPPNTDRWVEPPELEDELSDLDYRIDVKYGTRPYGFVDDALFDDVDLSTIHEDIFDVLDARIAATKHLLERRETDAFYGLLKSIDVIQHCFWTHMESDHPDYGDAILESYRRVDDLLAWIEDEVDANLLVFGDHGFGPRVESAPGTIDRLARAVDRRVSVPGVVQRTYDRLFKSEMEVSPDNPGKTTGVHADPAAWLAAGPAIGSDGETEIRFEDLTATILALVGHPIPSDYVGDPIDAVSEPYQVEDVDLSTRRRTSIDADEVVSERLHNLGYADMVDE